MVEAGEVDDNRLGPQDGQLNGPGVAMLQVGKPFPPGQATELRVGRGEAPAYRAQS